MQWKGAAEAAGMGINTAPAMIIAKASRTLRIEHHSLTTHWRLRRLFVVSMQRCSAGSLKIKQSTGLRLMLSDLGCIGMGTAQLEQSKMGQSAEVHSVPLQE
jgi:hypothetical protein